MTGLVPRASERNDRRSTTSRRRRQGRAPKPRRSVGIRKRRVLAESRKMPLSLGLSQSPIGNGGLAPRSREVISSAFHGRLLARNGPEFFRNASDPACHKHRRVGMGIADPDGPVRSGVPAGSEGPFHHRGPAHPPQSGGTDGLVPYAGAYRRGRLRADHLLRPPLPGSP